MNGRRHLAVAAALLLAIAPALSSCGGGATEATGSQATQTAEPAKASSTSSAASRPAYQPPALRRDVKVGPLRVTSGGVKQFSELGDYQTLRYGREASRPELERAARVMHGYLSAHMRYDWASSCSYLNERELEEVQTLASHFKQVIGRPCPEAISYLLGRVPPADTFGGSAVRAGAFRVNRDQGYLFYKVEGLPYMMPMSREDGEWKLFALFTTRVSRPPTPPPQPSG